MVTNNYEIDDDEKNKKTCAYTTPTHVCSSFWDFDSRGVVRPGVPVKIWPGVIP